MDKNKPACVSVLREVSSVDWNIGDFYNEFPLTRVLIDGSADILQIFLSVPDLSLGVLDIDGRNIALIAVEVNGGERQRCLELLCGDRRVDRYWNEANEHADTHGRQGDTPVMYCLKNDKIDMVRCIINTPGVDLKAKDKDGKGLKDIAKSVS